jgi:murein endopeptidase
LTLLISLVLTAFADTTPASAPAAGWVGSQLPKAEGLYERWDPSRSWATSYVVPVLESVAEKLAYALPFADPLLIGDISRRGGGHLPGHVTHHAGIDVDLGLFWHDGEQPLGGFVDLGPEDLDVHATWILLQALLDSGQVHYVLLDEAHIERLRRHAIELGVPRAEIDATFLRRDATLDAKTVGVVRHAPNHRSHLHVRLLPPAG